LKKNKHEASFLSKVLTSFSPGFIRFFVDWMMENPASYGFKAYLLIIMKRRKGFFIEREVE